MLNQEKARDSLISQKVKEKLSSIGIRAPCQVTAVCNKGQVTVSGSIQYEHQRPVASRAVKGVTGVQRVVDQMRLLVRTPQRHTNPEAKS